MNTQCSTLQEGQTGCCKCECGRELATHSEVKTDMALSNLPFGQSAQVCEIRARGELGRRLRDMGLLPGASVALSARAPLGDPIAVELEGCTLSLRCAEAAQVFVSVCP